MLVENFDKLAQNIIISALDLSGLTSRDGRINNLSAARIKGGILGEIIGQAAQILSQFQTFIQNRNQVFGLSAAKQVYNVRASQFRILYKQIGNLGA